SMITRYTGQQFAEGTSVPVGQVLELYVNFGSWLVFFGFAAIGGLLAYMDIVARDGLETGAFNRFITCFLAGLGLGQVGHEVATIVAGAAVGVLLTYGLQMFMRMRSRKAQNGVMRPTGPGSIGAPERAPAYARWKY